MPYTAEEVEERRRRGESRTDWAKLDALTDEDLRAARARDPDAVELPEDWPEHVIAGLPEPKEKISLRLDADVLRWFRSLGPGYQTRMNAVLRAYCEHERRRRPRREEAPDGGEHRGGDPR